MPDKRDTPLARAYTPTALPSVTARILAFIAILLGGLCGGVIGYAVTDLQCGTSGTVVVPVPPAADGSAGPAEDGTVPDVVRTEPASTAERGCTTVVGIGAVIGAVIGAAGVAVIAVLVLRAMAEWRKELDVEEPPDAPV